ncbi:hypothetical protein [Campylobacter geochelonis]|uniref:Uncharacterized protein n=1 Tax=Campylobacter geochelonis TaxID=1780362 RepID=A0A128EKT6_9BACT|nr:hypothetical protein [Campylobacter geochelonis]QKF71243.1 hypothetical protein CGEO_0927 [Campylobacter geochelonis]CZE49181.1 Uncharacterised protein [Campylobacter geochelonis]
MKKDNTLDKIDGYFEDKKDSEVQMYLIFAFIIIGFLVYLIAFQPAEDYFNQKQSELNSITTKLNEVDNYLASVSGPTKNDRNYEINIMQRRVQQEKDNLEMLKHSNEYFDKKLVEISYLTYNKQNWAKFLDSLTASAQENDIKIYSLHSDAKDLEVKKVQEVLDVNINAEGGFNNFLKYISAIEESDMVVDVNGLDINGTSGNLIGGNIKISVWGMKY